MTLNSTLKMILDQLSQNPAPKFWEVPIDAVRGHFRAGGKLMEPMPVPIGVVEDMEIDTPDGPLSARLYSPAGAGGVLPLIMFYHGGGFVIGDLDSHDPMCRRMSNASNCRVLSVDYRLAPEHKFPAAPNDCYHALVWSVKNASQLMIDPDKIAVAGDSAGGNLSAAVCLMAKENGGPKICYQCLIYPVTQHHPDTESRKLFGVGYFLESDTMQWFSEQYFGAKDDFIHHYSAPLLAEDLSGLPPALIITAGYDPLKDEGKAYADRLTEAGVPTSYINYPGMVHGFFSMAGIVPEARQALEKASRTIGEHLGS